MNKGDEYSMEERTLLANTRFLKQKIRQAREAELSKRRVELEISLKIRPFDVRSLLEIVDIGRELNDYTLLIEYLPRAIASEEIFDFVMYFDLGKSYFLYYQKEKLRCYLKQAIFYYDLALHSPKLKTMDYPLKYLEFCSMLLRFGLYQPALDILGTAATLYKDSIDWITIIQHNVAQIMLMLGNIEAAHDIYQELMLISAPVSVTIESEHIIQLTLRVINPMTMIEMSCILYRMKKYKLCTALFAENWDRMKKYGTGQILITDRVRLEERVIDLQLGLNDFSLWMGEPRNVHKLGILFHKECNFAIAAELYGMAVDMRLSKGYDHLSGDDKTELLSWILDRGEIYADFCLFEESERCAHLAFDLSQGYEVVALGRSARCCRRDVPENEEILKRARRVIQSVMRVQSIFKIRLERIRQRKIVLRSQAATKIISLFRMGLARSKTAPLRLSEAKILRIVKLCTSFEKNIWKTGRESLKNWKEIWHISAVRIQHCICRWYRRKKFGTFWKGMKSFQRIFHGQRVRMRLRNILSELQQCLSRCLESSSEINVADRIKLESKLLLEHGIRLDLKLTKRICSSSMLLIDNHKNIDHFACRGNYEEEEEYSSLEDHSSLNWNLSIKRVAHKFHMPLKSNDFLVSEGEDAVDQYQTWLFRQSQLLSRKKTLSSLRNHDSINSFRSYQSSSSFHNSVSSYPSSPMSVSSSVSKDGSESDQQSYLSHHSIHSATHELDPIIDPGVTWFCNNEFNVQKKQLLQSIKPSLLSTSMSSSYQSLTDKKSLAKKGKKLKKIKSSIHRKLEESLLFSARKLPENSKILPSPFITGARSSHDDPYELVSLWEFPYLQRFLSSITESQEIISLFSIINVNRDPTLQWIPFGLLPPEEVIRCLSCTSLSLTSYSFSLADCKRLIYYVKKCNFSRGNSRVNTAVSITSTETNQSKRYSKKNSTVEKSQIMATIDKKAKQTSVSTSVSPNNSSNGFQIWYGLRKLLIYGTSMGQDGLYQLLNLGVSHLISLSISSIRCNHRLGMILGSQMALQSCRIKYLYLEELSSFGSGGFSHLLKHLQRNQSLEMMVVRRCKLNERCVEALIRYIPLSSTLKELNLNDNHFHLASVKSIIRAFSQKGFKGSLRYIRLRHQYPVFTMEEALLLYRYASTLFVRLVADILPTRVETLEELADHQDYDQHSFQRITEVARESLRTGESIDLTKIAFQKIIHI